MLMTSRFSGGWSITPNLRDETGRSRMTAAGSQQVSESWPKTTTLGRTDGSIYISSILNVLASRTPQTREETIHRRHYEFTQSQLIRRHTGPYATSHDPRTVKPNLRDRTRGCPCKDPIGTKCRCRKASTGTTLYEGRISSTHYRSHHYLPPPTPSTQEDARLTKMMMI